MLLFGDCLLASPVSLSAFKATVDFGAIPDEPIYPIYSKNLMYKSENSVKPLKELEHTFRPENKNPFFLFPIVFSLAVIAMVFVFLYVLGKVGFEMKKDSMVKKVWKLLFFCLISLLVCCLLGGLEHD